MAAESVGSDKAELKRLLKRAMDEPVHMAFALDGTGKAVIQLDKLKQPKALEKQLKDSVENAKAIRFGTVVVDKDEDPKRVKFLVNKASGGVARKLIVALKGTGFTKVTLVSEDGSPAEEAQGEDEEEEPDAPAAAQADADAPAAPPAAPAAAPAMAAGPDAAGLTGQLTALVKQMLEAIKKNPSAKAALAELATDAQASLKRGDLDQAAAGIEILRQAIAHAAAQGPAAAPSSASAAAPAGNAAPAAAAAANGAASAQPGTAKPADPAAAQKLQKSKAAWSATRSKVDADLQKLKKAITDATKGDDTVQDIEKLFTTAVQPLLETLGDELTELLDRAATAQGEERDKTMAEVQRLIASHAKYVSSNPVIGHLDDNPFLPMSIGKTLSTTLSTLSAIVR